MSARQTDKWPHPYAGSLPDPLALAAEQLGSIPDQVWPAQSTLLQYGAPDPAIPAPAIQVHSKQSSKARAGERHRTASQNTENTESRADIERVQTLEARLKALEQSNPVARPISALRWTRDQVLGIKFSRYILSDRIEIHRVATELDVMDVIAGGKVELMGWCLVRPFEKCPPVLCKNPMPFSVYMQHPLFQADCEILKAHYKCTSPVLVGQLLYHIPHVGMVVHPALVVSYSRCVGGVFEQCVKQCLDMYVPPDGVLRSWTRNITTGDKKEMTSEQSKQPDQLKDTIIDLMNEHLEKNFGEEIKKYVAHQVSQCIADRLNRHEQNCNALEETLHATIEKEIQKGIKLTGTKMARVVKEFEGGTRKELFDRYQSIQQGVFHLSDRVKILEEARTMMDLEWLSLATWREDTQSRLQAHGDRLSSLSSSQTMTTTTLDALSQSCTTHQAENTRTLDKLQTTVFPALDLLRTRLDTLEAQHGNHTITDMEKMEQRLDRLEKSVSDDTELKQEIIELINEMQARVVDLVYEKVEPVVLRFVEQIVQGESVQSGGEQSSEKARLEKRKKDVEDDSQSGGEKSSEKARLEKRKKDIEGDSQSGGDKSNEKARLEKRKKEAEGRKKVEDGKKRVSPTQKSRLNTL